VGHTIENVVVIMKSDPTPGRFTRLNRCLWILPSVSLRPVARMPSAIRALLKNRYEMRAAFMVVGRNSGRSWLQFGMN
jgi:hypothetical protein